MIIRSIFVTHALNKAVTFFAARTIGAASIFTGLEGKPTLGTESTEYHHLIGRLHHQQSGWSQ